MHEETKNLIKTLAKRAELDFQNTRGSFQLEIEKFAAYTVVSQLRQLHLSRTMARRPQPLKNKVRKKNPCQDRFIFLCVKWQLKEHRRPQPLKK